MRCCSRSTTWRGSALIALALVAALPSFGAGVDDRDVRSAIEAAVRKQVGEPAGLAIRDLRLRGTEALEGSVFVTLPADARAGVPVRVQVKVMRADGRAARFGEAQCVIDLRLHGARTRRAVGRGETLAAADVEPVTVEASGWVLRPLPTEVTGARVTTDVPAGQVLHRQMVVAAPLVRSGEAVTITMRAGGLQVETRGVAAQAGRLGELIRVVNADSGRRLSARVVGPAAVEVHHGS